MMADYDSPRDHRQSNHDDSDHHQQQQQQQQQQPQRSTILERGRAVKLLRNGDAFFPGRAFVVNHRKYPMFEVFLDDASQALRANFGAVRCIYTPKNGTRLHDMSELEDHRMYVASGGERFKKLHYLDIAEGKRVSSKEKNPSKLPPVRRYDVEGRALRLSRSENVIIYVYRNGDPLTLPAKILLVKSTLQNWEPVLDEITRKVSLPNSAVLKLYAMNGELVTSAHQLEYNGMYVAAGKERYKRIEYPDPKSFSPNSSPKMSRKSDRAAVNNPIRQRKGEYQNNYQSSSDTFHPLQQRYTKSDGSNTHTTTANSHGSNEHAGQRRPVREEYDFFNSKPQQHRRGPTKETDLDRDDGGIYKGRLNHRERAREIDETRETKVELPVDYREVETVEEENLYGNAGRTPRRAQQPPSQPKANSRQRSPPSRTVKSPIKSNHDNDADDNNYDNDRNNKFSTNDHHNQNNSGFDNDYQRHTPPQTDNNHQRHPSPPPSKARQIEDEHRSRPSQSPSKARQVEDEHRSRPSPPPSKARQVEDEHRSRPSPPPPKQIDDEDNDERHSQRTPSARRQQERISSNTRSNPKDENHAATVIQSHVRGYLTRKQTHHEKDENQKQLTDNDSQHRPSPDVDKQEREQKQQRRQHSSSSSRNERRHDDGEDDNV